MRYQFNDLEMDTASMELRRGGRALAVEPQVVRPSARAY
jgi:hypothetical protein